MSDEMTEIFGEAGRAGRNARHGWLKPRAFGALTSSVALICLSCSTSPPPDVPEAATREEDEGAKRPVETSPTHEATVVDGSRSRACTLIKCDEFVKASDALSVVLRRDDPIAIGFGEAHTPAGFTARPTVRRFTEDLLPILAPTSSGLIVELLAPPSGCEAEKQATQREAEQVTQGQAETNQSDYLKLGQRSRELGVVPDILRASCGDMKAIADAGEEGVLVMMETIARLTGAAVVERSGRAPSGKPRVLAYGGALHNDQNPRPERDAWSYAKQLREATHDRYVEIDLIVPELVADTPAWQNFPWFAAYRELAATTQGALLLETAPRSYALVFAPHDAH